jgi:hypothetical protein
MGYFSKIMVFAGSIHYMQMPLALVLYSALPGKFANYE